MKETVSQLTWVDWVAFLAVLRGIWVGYRSGLFPELLRIVAYLATVLVTFYYHEMLAQYLTLKTFLNLTSATAVSFCVLLVALFGITKLITTVILKVVKAGSGGVVYKLLGVAVGVCRWIMLLSLFFMLIDYSPLSPLKTDIHDRSIVGPKIAEIAPAAFEYMSTLSPALAAKGKPI